MRRRPPPPVVAMFSFLAAAALLAVVVWPQGVAAGRLAPFIWAAALRIPLLLALGAAAVILVVLAWRRPRSRVVLVPVAAALVLAALANGAVLVSRGFDSSARGADRTHAAAAGTVRVLSWNTEHAAPGPLAIAAVITDAGADIVMLPETDAAATGRIAAELVSRGHRVEHDTIDHPDFPGSVPTSIMFLDAYADAGYVHLSDAGSTPGQPSGLWGADGESTPVVGAVHTVPPMPWAVPLWSAGLDWVASACTDPLAIIAGDLNATVDHMVGLGAEGADIGRCRDAAKLESAAARGTWPSDVPEWSASPIDHILVGSAWQVVSFDVVEDASAPGSDHRPVVAELMPTV